MKKILILIILLTGVLISLPSLADTTITIGGSISIENNFDKDILENLNKVELEDKNRIYIEIGGGNIYFVPDMEDVVYISDDLRTDELGSRFTIRSPKKGLFNWFNKKNYKVVIGTKNPFRLIDIKAGGIVLSGALDSDELNINAGGVDMTGEYYCQDISINGAGMDIEGYIEAEYMSINGAGIDLTLEVAGINDLDLNGVGVDAEIKYVDSWEGVRKISLNGVGGNLNVLVPSETGNDKEGHLDIDTNGIIETDIDYY